LCAHPNQHRIQARGRGKTPTGTLPPSSGGLLHFVSVFFPENDLFKTPDFHLKTFLFGLGELFCQHICDLILGT
jgi:hypothetical protein